MQGKIIKGIAGFYYVYAEETDTIYECKAKGIFRNRRVKPLVGDLVAIEVLDEEQAKALLTACHEQSDFQLEVIINLFLATGYSCGGINCVTLGRLGRQNGRVICTTYAC